MNLWTRARQAFVERLAENLTGLKVKQLSRSGDWLSVVCPLCEDKGGSASISVHSAQLNCKQCGENLRLFDWYARSQGLGDPWAACKQIAEAHGIRQPIRRGRPRKDIVQSEVDVCCSALWDEEAAKPFRDELERRGFSQLDCAELFIGYRDGKLIFFQLRHDGTVRPRAHQWLGPWSQKFKWCWTGGSTEDPNCFWPMHVQPAEKDVIIITEGEMDCMIGRCKLEWPGFAFYAWTGGVTTPCKWSHIPDWMVGRRIIFLPDNDTWQGLHEERYFAPDDKKAREMAVRRRKALETCHVLDRIGCEVELGQVPIDPKETWGGDLRDWYNQGGRDLNEIALTPYKLVKEARPIARDTELHLAMALPGEQVRFEATTLSADMDQRWLPDYISVACERGTYKFCEKCRVFSEFPEGVAHMTDPEMRDLLAQCMIERYPEKIITEKVFGIPRACNYHRIEPSNEGRQGTIWIAKGFSERPEDNDECLVISDTAPDSSGQIQVEGKMLHTLTKGQVFCRADVVHASQSDPVDLSPFLFELRQHCPWDEDSVDAIHEYIAHRCDDLTSNVTQVFGQNRIVKAYDLLMHSALWLSIGGRKRRGWIDASIVGVTRSGKSEIVRRLNNHFGEMSRVVSTQDNFSLAGLVAGNVRGRDGNFRVKAGLLPSSHRKALVLDEFHAMHRGSQERSLLESLQECRDVGFIQTVKVAGNLRLPAAVRLMTIANPPASFSRYRYPCEMLLQLYVAPESLARLDYGIVITEPMHEAALAMKRFTTTEFWASDIATALVKRAWELPPQRIIFSPEALAAADETLRDWNEVLSTDLPLFTGPEKRLSLLRVAVAIANICFAHPRENPMMASVRRSHVLWARQYFEETWQENGFLERCNNNPKRRRIDKPLHVEWLFVKYFPDADDAGNSLNHFFRRLSRMEIQSLIGIENKPLDQWVRNMISLNAMTLESENTNFAKYAMTDAGIRLLHKVIENAEENPEYYRERRRTLDMWLGNETQELPLGANIESLDPLIDESEEVPF